MQLTVRPHLAAGVALVGASAIAISPLAPSMPDVPEVVSRAVAPTAFANPFGPVFADAVTNIEKLIAAVAANPAPILTQVVENQIAAAGVLGGIGWDYVENFANFLTGSGDGVTLPGQLADAFEAFEDGDYSLAFGLLAAVPILFVTAGNVFGTLGEIIPELGGLLAQPFTNMAAAITAATNPQNLLPVLLGFTQLTTGTAQAFGEGLEGVASAIRSGDPGAVLYAALEGVAGTVDVFLNGGLLASSPADAFSNGILGGLLWLRNAVAQAIAPQPTTPLSETARMGAVDELPNPEPTLVTVAVTSDDGEPQEEPSKADGATTAEQPVDDVPAEATDEEVAEEEAALEEVPEDEVADEEVAEEEVADEEAALEEVTEEEVTEEEVAEEEAAEDEQESADEEAAASESTNSGGSGSGTGENSTDGSDDASRADAA